MFCQKCGASVPEGAKFCENCGAPVAAAPKPPVQQANPQPGYQQPYAPTYQPPVNRQQGYQPYVPTYQPTIQPAETRSIAPMIAPIVLAGLAMLLCFISWIRGSQNIEYFAESIGYDFANFFTLLTVVFTDLLLMLASLFFFLYGLVQYRKGRTSLFGVGCLMFFIASLLQMFSVLAWIISRAADGYDVVPRQIVFFLLLAGCAVMMLIGAINGFHGKIKAFPVIGAGLFFLCDLISFINNQVASNAIALAASTLLFVAILLIAIFARPKDE